MFTMTYQLSCSMATSRWLCLNSLWPAEKHRALFKLQSAAMDELSSGLFSSLGFFHTKAALLCVLVTYFAAVTK